MEGVFRWVGGCCGTVNGRVSELEASIRWMGRWENNWDWNRDLGLGLEFGESLGRGLGLTVQHVRRTYNISVVRL